MSVMIRNICSNTHLQ